MQEKKNNGLLCQGIKTVVSTVAGASLGVIGGMALCYLLRLTLSLLVRPQPLKCSCQSGICPVYSTWLFLCATGLAGGAMGFLYRAGKQTQSQIVTGTSP